AGSGLGAVAETPEPVDEFTVALRRRVARDDYNAWLRQAEQTGGCARPVRLVGTVETLDTRTGDVVSTLDTHELPDKVLYKACGDRRASVCPACSERYKADAYHLIRAGL